LAKTFGVIYVDPPWEYANPKNHDPAMGGVTYPTLSLDEMKSLPIDRIADRHCALFLWATMPKLQEAMEVIAAWGFRYTTCAFTWVKTNPKKGGIYSGLGSWTNGNAELCLFAKKGSPERVFRNVKQIVMAPRGRHSAKPPEVRDRIVRLMGDVPRIELFARERTDGWVALGNEIDGKDIRVALFELIRGVSIRSTAKQVA
jgi:N6-adenosine-specific RNA methylase IME4